MVNLTLNTEERILLWINRFMLAVEGSGYVWMAPATLTQKGIERGLLVRQAYVSRTLGKLMGEGMIRSVLAHTDAGRRKNVYILTAAGREAAAQLLKQMETMEVTVQFPDGDIKVTLRKAADMLKVPLSKLALDVKDGVITAPRIKNRRVFGIPKTGEVIGRTNERIKIERILKKYKSSLIHVFGIPGIGKSTLMADILRHMDDYSIFWYDIKPWTSVDRILYDLREFLEPLGYKGNAVEADISRFLFKKGSNIIITLDDVPEGREDINELIRVLVERHSGPIVLISRIKLRINEGVERSKLDINLTGLDKASTSKLLKSLNVSTKHLDALYETTKGYPIIIKLIAHHNSNSISLNSDAADFIKKELTENFEPEEAEVAKLLSVFRQPVHIPLLIHTIQGKKDKKLSDMFKGVIQAVDTLYRAGVITLDSDGKQQIHPHVSDVILKDMGSQQAKKYHRLATEYYRNVVNEGEFWGISPKEVNISIQEYVYHSVTIGKYQNAIRTVEASGPTLIKQGYTEILNILEDLNTRKFDAQTKMDYYLILGDLYLVLNDPKRARTAYNKAMRIKQVRTLSKENPELAIINRMAKCNLEIGNIKKSIELGKKAVELSKKEGKKAEIKAYNNLGVIMSYVGKDKEAENAYKQAVSSAKKISTPTALSRTYKNLGFFYLSRGHPKKAIENFKAALEADSTKEMETAEIKKGLANAYISLNQANMAKPLLMEAMVTYKKIGPSYLYYIPLVNYFRIVTEHGDEKEVENAIKEIRTVFTVIKGNSNDISDEYRIRAFNEILTLAGKTKKISDYLWLTDVHRGVIENANTDSAKKLALLANKMMKHGYFDAAIKLYNMSYEIAERVNDDIGRITLLLNMAVAESKLGNIKRCKANLNRARTASKKIGYSRGIKQSQILMRKLVR